MVLVRAQGGQLTLDPIKVVTGEVMARGLLAHGVRIGKVGVVNRVLEARRASRSRQVIART